MKRQIAILLTLLLLGALMGTSALAWSEYGAVYTAIDELSNDRLESQGTDMLPTLSESISFGLYVDIVDDLEGYDITEYAALFYEQYGYGEGSAQGGALMMLYVTEQEGQVSIQDCCVYGDGVGREVMASDASDGMMEALAAVLSLEEPMSYEAAGEACADAVDIFAAQMSALVLERTGATLTGEAAVPEASAAQRSSAPEVSETASAEDSEALAAEPAQTSAASAAQTTQSLSLGQLIIDNAELLTEKEKLRLEDKAQRISQQYGCNIYVLTVPTMDGAERREFAKAYYTEHQLGSGEYRNGILFMIAMDTRDYVTITYGRNPEDTSQYGSGILAFTDYGISQLEEQVVPYLSEGDYYTAFDTYVDTCRVYLSTYDQGTPYDVGVRLPGEPIFGAFEIGIIILVPLLIAFIVCMVFRAQMKTAVKATRAGDYLVDGSFHITESRDDFIRTTRSRRKIERTSSSGGGSSGGSTVDSDGFGGSSGGKF